MELVWYVVPWSNPVLGFPSRVQSLDWASMPFVASGVGEVYDTPRIYNGQWSKPFIDGGHVCGTPADFAGHSVKDEELPPVVYNEADLPLCCQPPFLGLGGAVAGGTADVEVVTHDYCTAYAASVVGTHPADLVETITDEEWFGISISGVVSYTLRSPLYPGNTDWTVTLVILFIPETHNYLPNVPDWDGQGFAAFTDTHVPPVNEVWITCDD